MLALLSIAVAALAAHAPTPAPADTVVWRGTLAGRRDTTQVRLLIVHDAERWSGRLRLCRASRAADFPLDSVRVDLEAARDDSVPVTFLVRRMAGRPHFAGVVSWDDRIVGTLRTTHGERAVALTRAADAGSSIASRLSCP